MNLIFRIIQNNKKLFLNIFNILEPIFFAVSLISVFLITFVPIWFVMLWLELTPVFWLIPLAIGFAAHLYWAFVWVKIMNWVKNELKEEIGDGC